MILSVPKELRLLISLAIPVFLAQFAQTSMGFVDTVVAGRASAIDMAGVAVASSFWMPLTLFATGILMPITPLVAQARGAGNTEGLGRYLRQGAWMALCLAAFLMVTFTVIAKIIPTVSSIDPKLADVSSRYIQAVLWGVPGLMLYSVQRAFLEGHGRTRPAMIAGFLGLGLNIPLNIIFVFGYFGMPALGGVGCGVATAIICWVMGLTLIIAVKRLSPRAIRFEKFNFSIVSRVLRIGIPGAFALLIESSIFAIIAILIAPLGPIVVAGHQVALNVSGMVFMLPLSIGVATSIRVGYYLGAKEKQGAHRARWVGIGFAFCLSFCVALLIMALRYMIPTIYTSDAEVISLAAFILIFAALYQCSDAVQIVAVSALRGYNDTAAVFVVTILAYWCLTLPLGYTLAMTNTIVPAMGVTGFWFAIVFGLTVAAVLFLFRIARLEKLPMDVITKKINR